ncbi:hypothetical protein QN277_017829 [Acacia crassicarpa]|uniref:LOB domain-containing protein n=1 Tax=Acacia crassicarpa TaxID=499986 RepID=A0AAE1JPU8_9FABA|nr:hypothetical protein QN277_017829 [Acacia crassicarpa]
MSCNGCRVLRKGCSQDCALKACLLGIPSPHSQAQATLFLAKFFGRTDLISFISSVPLSTRPALFRSLLYEACGRIVNPVSGAVGLLWSGNWHLCEAAVQTILAGGVLQPLPETSYGLLQPIMDESSPDIGKNVRSRFRPFMHEFGEKEHMSGLDLCLLPGTGRRQSNPLVSGESEMRSCGGSGAEKNIKLLNLFG